MSSNNQAKVVIHHLENSRSLRIVWLCEELGLNYEIKEYKRNPETHLAPKELTQVHPLGKSPVITVEENGKSVTLAESGAIVEFLTRRYGKNTSLGPNTDDLEEDANWQYWMHYAEGSLMLPLMLKLIFTIIPNRMPFFLKPVASPIFGGIQSKMVDPMLKSHTEYIEQTLEKSGGFFVGNRFTAVDIIMSYPVSALPDRDKYPAIAAYWKKLSAMPAYERAVAKGGDVDFSVFQK